MSITRHLFALWACLLLTACTSQAPDTQRYLLRADSPAMAMAGDDPPRVIIGQLRVAPYIDHLGLVIETGAGEVRTARYHEWAEPLRESLRSFLADEIATRSGASVQRLASTSSAAVDGARVLDIRVDQLHGARDGNAVLVAWWSIRGAPGQTPVELGFSAREPLSADGYAALVRAEKQLLRDLAAAIAASLETD